MFGNSTYVCQDNRIIHSSYTVLDIYLYIVFSPPVRGFHAYLYTCTCIYMWPLAPMEYNLSIPNMVSKRIFP
jgi:hypothetical protein